MFQWVWVRLGGMVRHDGQAAVTSLTGLSEVQYKRLQGQAAVTSLTGLSEVQYKRLQGESPL